MEVLYPRCAGLDVHKATVVAAVRLVAGGKVAREVRTFATTTAGLLELAEWLAENGKRCPAVTAFRHRRQPRAARPASSRAATVRARGSWSGPRPRARARR